MDFGVTPVVILLTIMASVALNLINDRRIRRKRAVVLEGLRGTRHVHVDTKSTIKGYGAVAILFGAGIHWQRSEVYFIDKSAICFFYISVFGSMRIFSSAVRVDLDDAKIPLQLPDLNSWSIDSAEFNNHDLVLSHKEGNLLYRRKRIVTLKNIDRPGDLDTIKQMMRIA